MARATTALRAVKPDMQAAIEAERQRISSQIKDRLAAPEITIVDARDGLKDCFVVSYLGGVTQGLANFELRGSVEQIAKVTEAMFRRRLNETGSSWEQPSIEALESVLSGLNHDLHIDKLPSEIKGLHDQVCTLLIGKAAGEMPHVGHRSAVKASLAKDASRALARDPVEMGIRQSIAAYLVQFRQAVLEQPEPPETLLTRLSKLSRLIETLQDLKA